MIIYVCVYIYSVYIYISEMLFTKLVFIVTTSRKREKNYKTVLLRRDENKNTCSLKFYYTQLLPKAKRCSPGLLKQWELHSLEIETHFFHPFSGGKNLSRADLLWYVRNLQSPKIVARSQQHGEFGEIPIGWPSSPGWERREHKEHIPGHTSHIPLNFGV